MRGGETIDRIRPRVRLLLSIMLMIGAASTTMAGSSAEAAGQCGRGYKEGVTEGYFDQGVNERNGRRIITKVGGYVRWCTHDDAYDQTRRRVKIGIPHAAYARGDFTGRGVEQVCLIYKAVVKAIDIDQGTQISASWDPMPGVSVGKSYGDKTMTVTLSLCKPPRSGLLIQSEPMTFTVPEAGMFNEPKITGVRLSATARMTFREGGTSVMFGASASDSNDGTTRDAPDDKEPSGADTSSPVLAKPVASLNDPYSRTASYSIEATDDVGVTQMRVKATGDTAWRSWVDYVPSGTVILPDRYGDFTIWFQVRDAAGNLSSQRAADNVTRLQDTTAPSLGKPVATRSDGNSPYVSFSLDASDNTGSVPHMRVRLGPVEPEWRAWQSFVPNGTVVLPGYGDYMIWFQVMDPYGNVSFERATDLIRRTAAVNTLLQQVDNNGNVRSCGAESNPCTDIVRKFRSTISSDILPKTDLLVKLWRKIDGTWVETQQSPYARYAITGSTHQFEFPSGALPGLWRVQVQIPRDDANYTDFSASNYQYIQKT